MKNNKRTAFLIRKDKKRMLRELKEIGEYEKHHRFFSHRKLEKHYIQSLMILSYDK